jgi:hypothetical protein
MPVGQNYSTAFDAGTRVHVKLEDSFQAGPLKGSVQFEGSLEARLGGQASATITPGNVELNATIDAYAGASAHLGADLALGPYTLSGDANLAAEAYARAAATAKIGIDGIHVGLNAEALVAASAGGHVDLYAGPLTADASFQAGFGLGASLNLDAEISGDRIGFDVAAALGVGLFADADLDVGFSPGEMIDGIENDPVGSVVDLVEWSGGTNLDSAGGYIASSSAASMIGGFNPVSGLVANLLVGVAGEVGHAIENTLGDVPVFEQIIDAANWVADAVDTVFDTAGDVFAFWDWF